jgi:3-oxoisoapionate decarboxylase
MQIGISSYTLPWSVGITGFPQPEPRLTAEDLVKEAQRLEVGVLQIADNLPLHTLSVTELGQLSVTARDLNIEIEVGTRGVEPAHLLVYLDIAKRLGARLVRTLTHTSDSTPDLAQVEQWLREVLPAFASHNISIALENYERHTSGELRSLVENIGSPWIGICLDTVNSLGALEVPRMVVEELGDHVLNLHVKDFRITRNPSMLGYDVRGCAVGDGRLDVPWLLTEMKVRNRNPNLIIEQWVPYPGCIDKAVEMEREWTCRSVQFMKETVALAAIV